MRSARVELILDTLKGVKGAKDLTRELDGTSKALGDTAREGDKAGRAIDDVGDEMSDAARAAAMLDHQIEELNDSLRAMAIAQTLTGDNFSKHLREQEAQVRRLTRNRKLFGDLGEDAAPEFALSFMQRLGPLIAKLPISGPMAIALAGAGVAAAPLLASAIAGGVIGGVGIGGVMGGLALAAKDERVDEAAKQLGDRLSSRLNQAAGTFVQPALQGLKDIEKAADGINIEQIFADSARLVPVLTGGVTSALSDLGDGIESLVANAGPPVAAIADGIAQIGETIGEGLTSLSDNSDSAAGSLSTLFGVVDSGVSSTFRLLNVLIEVDSWLDENLGGVLALDGALQLLNKVMGDSGDQARNTGSGFFGQADAIRDVDAAATIAKETQAEMTAVQKGLTLAQNEYNRSLDSLAPKAANAAALVEGLKKASQLQFGAAINASEANEQYQASFDGLSDSVKRNKGSLDANSKAGRANRDSLEALLQASNEMYFANIAQGQSTDSARRKHEARTEAVRREAIRLGLNRTETKRLIDTYGKIPGKKTTNLVQSGLERIFRQMSDLYVLQRLLAQGVPASRANVAAEKAAISNKVGPDKRGGGFHAGGYTGNVGVAEPAGIVHGREWVINAASTAKIERKNPGLLKEMNATGQVPGYATGGLVFPVDQSRSWRFPVDLSHTYVMSKAAAMSKVMAAFGDWPSSPSAQRGDSGVWRRIVALIRSTGPMSGHFGNAYRPGDPLWHGSGRAVDWMGYNQDRLARFLAARRPLELIHRTNSRDYAYTRGVNKGSFNNALMQAHRNHIHIAMANGGMIREPVFGVGRSGATYSFGERGVPERVTPASAPGGGSVTVNVQAGYVVSERQLQDKITATVDDLLRKNRIG